MIEDIYLILHHYLYLSNKKLNLYNNGNVKFDQNLINFSKELETLERTKDNKHRKTL